jgi:hypothetical protein
MVDVLETGHRDADGRTAGEWWRIRSGAFEGYARAVDAAGVRNLQLT